MNKTNYLIKLGIIIGKINRIVAGKTESSGYVEKNSHSILLYFLSSIVLLFRTFFSIIRFFVRTFFSIIRFFVRTFFSIFKFFAKTLRRFYLLCISLFKKFYEKTRLFLSGLKKKAIMNFLNSNLHILYQAIKYTYYGDGSIASYRVNSIKNYCVSNNQPYSTISEGEKTSVYYPEYFQMKNSEELFFKTPELYTANLNHVTIIGGTSIIIANDQCLCDAFFNDTSNRISLSFPGIVKINKDEAIIHLKNDKHIISKGIDLLGFASYNYYHLTVEILSRLKYIDDNPEYDSYPILVDSVVKDIKQYSQMLKTINSKKRKIIYAENGECLLVEDLVVPSYNTWMPINVKEGVKLKDEDFIIAPSGITNIRYHTYSDKEKKSKKRIFISRKNTQNSRLINEDAIAALFRQHGFEIVKLEEYSYKKQIELFKDCSVVVGASGAALTNIVYCKPETVFVCIIPEQYHFCMYSTIANIIGLRCIFLNPEIVVNTRYMSMDQWKLDELLCEQFIDTYFSN